MGLYDLAPMEGNDLYDDTHILAKAKSGFIVVAQRRLLSHLPGAHLWEVTDL